MKGLFSCELTYRERLSLAWQLTLPAVLTDVVWSFFVYIVLEIRAQGAELFYLIPYLLFIAPWLVRRMFRRQYPTFRLKTLGPAGPMNMGYNESFKVMWLLSWRSSILTLAAIFALSLFGRLLTVELSSLVPSSQQAPFFNAAGLSVFENTLALFVLPLVMPGMFTKRYQGFRVAAERLKPRP